MCAQHFQGFFSDWLEVGHNVKLTAYNELLIEEVEKFVPYNPPLLMPFFEPRVGKVDGNKGDTSVIDELGEVDIRIRNDGVEVAEFVFAGPLNGALDEVVPNFEA